VFEIAAAANRKFSAAAVGAAAAARFVGGMKLPGVGDDMGENDRLINQASTQKR
jgi:hypothetical protein